MLVQVRVFQSPTLVVELPLVPIIQEGVDHATTWKREASNTNPQDSLAQPLPSPQHTMLRRLQHLPVSSLLQSVTDTHVPVSSLLQSVSEGELDIYSLYCSI